MNLHFLQLLNRDVLDYILTIHFLFPLSIGFAFGIGLIGILLIWGLEKDRRPILKEFIYPKTKLTLKALYAITSIALTYAGFSCLILLSLRLSQ